MAPFLLGSHFSSSPQTRKCPLQAPHSTYGAPPLTETGGFQCLLRTQLQNFTFDTSPSPKSRLTPLSLLHPWRCPPTGHVFPSHPECSPAQSPGLALTLTCEGNHHRATMRPHSSWVILCFLFQFCLLCLGGSVGTITMKTIIKHRNFLPVVDETAVEE